MDVSIIIVNFNTFSLTRNCIASIYDSVDGKTISFEIILVDNASTDAPAAAFKTAFPDIHLIASDTNMGFGRANNAGMAVARGRFFMLLNSDTIVLPGAIEKCLRFITSPTAEAQNIGLIGCKLLNEDRTLQPSVFPYLNNNLWTYFKTDNPVAFKILQLLRADKHHNFNFDTTQRVGDVSGACMFMRADVARTSGFFDTDFFLYCEDTEWIRERIGKVCNVYYFADAAIIHLGGRSAPRDVMYIQSKLSLSLMWYKKGWLNYAGYIAASAFNTLTIVLTLPCYSPGTRANLKKAARAFVQVWPYLFGDITAYGRGLNQRKKRLVYRGALAAMKMTEADLTVKPAP